VIPQVTVKKLPMLFMVTDVNDVVEVSSGSCVAYGAPVVV
jgi:hypothetical protein